MVIKLTILSLIVIAQGVNVLSSETSTVSTTSNIQMYNGDGTTTTTVTPSTTHETAGSTDTTSSEHNVKMYNGAESTTTTAKSSTSHATTPTSDTTTTEGNINMYKDGASTTATEKTSTTKSGESTTTTEATSTKTTEHTTQSNIQMYNGDGTTTTTTTLSTTHETTGSADTTSSDRDVKMYTDSPITLEETTNTEKTTPMPFKNLTDKEIADWDQELSWRMPFGDPKHGWPLDSRELRIFCQTRMKITKDSESQFFNALYPDNDLVKKVGNIFAEEETKHLGQFCQADMYSSSGNTIFKRGMTFIMGSRDSKMIRDMLIETLMYNSKHTKESSLEKLICILMTWLIQTEGLYPDDNDVREIIKAYLTGTFQKIVSLVEDEKKIKKATGCELDHMPRVDERPPESLQLLVLKALNSLTKK